MRAIQQGRGQCDTYIFTIYCRYERKIRDLSPPHKVFEYFASQVSGWSEERIGWEDSGCILDKLSVQSRHQEIIS